ncbi:MAG: nucleoside deaminase [Alphaproteobacteria bacterium]|nr:nucleoside deaminase [Alphaproteobacteria bacterium]
MSPEQLMRRAIELSRKSLSQKQSRPFGALIAKDGVIVGEGASESAFVDPTAHGEILAIRDACRRLGSTDLSGHEIYTSCEPCPLCVAAIWWSKLDRLYYANTLDDCERIGISTRDLVEEIRKPIEARRLPSQRILAAEARQVFDDWRAQTKA